MDMSAVEDLHLARGAHNRPEDGMCAMEAVAFLAGEKHSDHPACACPVLGAFMRAWNDALPDEERDILKPYLKDLIGSRSTRAVELKRSWMAFDWLVRVNTPAWLELVDELKGHAVTLRGLPPLSGKLPKASRDAVYAANTAANAQYNKAWDKYWAAEAEARAATARAATAAATAAEARAATAAAVKERLEPTRRSLRDSALLLLEAMISVKS